MFSFIYILKSINQKRFNFFFIHLNIVFAPRARSRTTHLHLNNTNFIRLGNRLKNNFRYISDKHHDRISCMLYRRFPPSEKKNLMEHYNIITMASNWGSNETLKFIYRDYN